MAFDSTQIAAFLAVSREGSLGRAAAALGVTQPALSRLIQRLEHRLGAALFERTPKGMQATDVGQAFLPHATLLQAEAEQALEEIRALRGLAKGTARVGAIASVASSVLPGAIDSLLARTPGLRFEVLEGVWDVLAAALARRDIDVAFAPVTPDTDEIVAVPSIVWSDITVVVAATDHPLRRDGQLSLHKLASAKWALPPRGSAPHRDLERIFADQGLGMPQISVETRSITMLKSLVMASGFVSLMAEPMFSAERRLGLIDGLSLPQGRLERTLTAFRRRRGVLPRPSAELVAELKALLRRAGHLSV